MSKPKDRFDEHEEDEIITPTGSYHDLHEIMKKGNPDPYRRSYKPVPPEEATKKVTFWDTLKALFRFN
ncbi:MAG: hypothetical protein ACE5JB_16830 [bacterium]